MIQLHSVDKRYTRGGVARTRGGVEALRGVTLDVPAGGVTAVVGPNGAGKSTLFGVVLGFLRATGGEVTIDGLSPRRYVRRRGAAYLPERFQLPGGWNVRAALLALARLGGARGSAARAAADDAIDRFGLRDAADRAVRDLSRGTLQRLGIAQTDLARPDLVVLDEPAQGLDPLWRIRLREWIAGLARERRTILLASHDLAEVERLAHRVVLLEDGELRAVFAPDAGARGGRWRVDVRGGDAGDAAILAAFPGARPLDATHRGPADGASHAHARRFEVDAADARDLSERLAAAIAAGAAVFAVTPAAERLEERVRRSLRGAGEGGAAGGRGAREAGREGVAGGEVPPGEEAV